VTEAAAAELTRLESEYRRNRHEILEARLSQIVEARLLDLEARARKTTKEALLAGLETAAATDAEVDAFYEENKARIPRPKSEVAEQIREYLTQQQRVSTMAALRRELEARYKADIRFGPFRVPVQPDGPSRGGAAAKVTIIAFSDFECPFCSRFVPVLKEVEQKYGDRVRVVFRQFPLDIHANARKAAEASLCANEQGKFWEMHDAMFENQKALAPEGLKATAARLQLKSDAFDACLDSGKFASRVEGDVRAGGDVPFEEIAAVIDDELQRAAKKEPAKK
jgi:protein-disulfide isomerase